MPRNRHARILTAVHHDLARGLRSLTAIAATAPLLGALAAADAIVGSFVGGGGEKSAMLAALTLRLSYAIVPTALGIAVAILSHAVNKLLAARLEHIDVEMNDALLALPEVLRPCRLIADL